MKSITEILKEFGLEIPADKTVTSNPYTNSTNIEAGKTYYYKIIALCDQSSYGNSAYSNVVSITAK